MESSIPRKTNKKPTMHPVAELWRLHAAKLSKTPPDAKRKKQDEKHKRMRGEKSIKTLPDATHKKKP